MKLIKTGSFDEDCVIQWEPELRFDLMGQCLISVHVILKNGTEISVTSVPMDEDKAVDIIEKEYKSGQKIHITGEWKERNRHNYILMTDLQEV